MKTNLESLVKKQQAYHAGLSTVKRDEMLEEILIEKINNAVLTNNSSFSRRGSKLITALQAGDAAAAVEALSGFSMCELLEEVLEYEKPCRKSVEIRTVYALSVLKRRLLQAEYIGLNHQVEEMTEPKLDELAECEDTEKLQKFVSESIEELELLAPKDIWTFIDEQAAENNFWFYTHRCYGDASWNEISLPLLVRKCFAKLDEQIGCDKSKDHCEISIYDLSDEALSFENKEQAEAFSECYHDPHIMVNVVHGVRQELFRT